MEWNSPTKHNARLPALWTALDGGSQGQSKAGGAFPHSTPPPSQVKSALRTRTRWPIPGPDSARCDRDTSLTRGATGWGAAPIARRQAATTTFSGCTRKEACTLKPRQTKR
eukprot:3665162-Rhodomonas_salina.2